MSKNIVRVNKTKNYTVMSNTHLKDENLSWKAKGIHSYILSLPDDWKVIVEHLKKVSTDGERSTRSGIKELYELRYWQKYPVYINGKVDQWVTEIYEEPFPESQLIKSIVIRDGKKITNYENGKSENEFLEDDLLCQNVQVGEPVENTESELLCQNVDVGNVDVGNAGLLNTNNTNITNCTNHSFIQDNKKNNNNENKKNTKKENERMNEDRKKLDSLLDKLDLNDFKDKPVNNLAIKRAIETLWYKKSINSNGLTVTNEQIRSDLKFLTSDHIINATNIFIKESERQEIKNRIGYLAICIYNSIFDIDMSIHNQIHNN